MDSKFFRLSQFLRTPDEDYHFARTIIHQRNELSCHHHDFSEILWIDKGTGIHHINDNNIEISNGTLVMIRPEDSHTLSSAGSGSGIRVTNLAFKKETLDFLRSRYYSSSQTFFWHKKDLPFAIQLSIENFKKLEMLSDRMLNAPRDKINLDLFLLRIFQLVESEMKIQQYSDTIPPWLVSAMEKYNHPDQLRKGVHGFVSLTQKTIDHTNRTMRKCYQTTLTDYIIKKRMEYAANQIIMTASPIKLICEECGFNNLGYFYNTFKEHFKLTPVKYRKINQKII
jgi:quercetin dioxygenase-like cupin family protein